LNSSIFHGFNPDARHISDTVCRLIPCLSGIERVDQCVAPFGNVSKVSITICSTTSSPIVRAAARDRAVGLRIVGDQPEIPETDCIVVGPIEVEFDVPPASITESTTPAGIQLHVSWPVDQVEVRVTVANRA